MSSGNNAVPVSGTDGGGNVKTNTYQVSLTGPSNSSLTYDQNGCMTSDGIKSYSWDAEKRLIKITYPGSGNNSQFTYDAMSGLVKIVETASGSVTSTKQFVRCGSQICEERNAGSAITKQFFAWGQTISGTNYYYFRNHLGSITDVFTADGTVVAHYEYDPYGQVTQTVGTLASDFQYAGYYFHAPSGLNLTTYRAYNPTLGRWINRDQLDGAELFQGPNLYQYCHGNPVSLRDPLGLDAPFMGRDSSGNLPGYPDTAGAAAVGAINDVIEGTPIGSWSKACRLIRSVFGNHADCNPTPRWCPIKWNPPTWQKQPDNSNDSGPPPYVWPGSPPWDPKASAPYNGRA